ncbi:hypothetical protein QM012_009349 [Aureobasidium pullulans]|uniref:Uncharacterized protein n=1 Tax=Aureobasidium pullulans TaxID=5580 RepID=A0ABR0TGL0_AURPU
MASTAEDMIASLRAQIKDNLRFTHPKIGEPIITVAYHDKLYWVVVCDRY